MIFLAIFLSLTLYLFFHFRTVIPGVRGTLFSAAIILLFVGGFSFRGSFAGTLLEAIFTVWLCEAALVFVLWDLFRLGHLAFCRKKFDSKFSLRGHRIAFGLGVLISGVFFLIGVPQNENYQIRGANVAHSSVEKPFTAVFFSDLHVDPLFSKKKLVRFAAELDSIAPDYLLFGGDLADVTDKVLSEMGYDSLFQELTKSAKIAAIGINGNHEAYAERSGSQPENWMRRNGMIVLDDSTACTPLACFTGRTDFQVARSRDVDRLPLLKLLPADTSKPWILLDHQPKGIEPEYSGKLPTLAISGHTHNGQFFPATALIGLFWRLADGFGSLDGVPWIVSSGIDSWGPPVRVGSRTDIWVIHFNPSR
ncbi:MAG: metallophosphoesterase [Fibrobacter sp.]|nr:metallophosphoesterase [Fibrobacter sp.]